jgi:hypothetical protein
MYKEYKHYFGRKTNVIEIQLFQQKQSTITIVMSTEKKMSSLFDLLNQIAKNSFKYLSNFSSVENVKL